MPSFRVAGNVSVPFFHSVEAESEEEARRIVENLRLEALDDTRPSEGENTIYLVEVEDE